MHMSAVDECGGLVCVHMCAVTDECKGGCMMGISKHICKYVPGIHDVYQCMSACIYVYNIYIYICIYVYIYICILYIYMSMYIYIYIYIYVDR